MFWLSDVDAHMNYAPGFTQFEVYYSSTSYPGTLSFWTGVDGTGTQVGSTIGLTPLGSGCGGDPNLSFNPQDLPKTNQVPAPLPILGSGAAFASLKKLRSLSSKLNSFSMS